MNFKQRLDARRDQQPSQSQQLEVQNVVRREAAGQAISSSQIREEQEHKQRFDAFKEAHGRHAISEREFDQWQATQRQAKTFAQPKVDDRAWDVAMRSEVAAPVLKDRKPIDLPAKLDALDRVASQRQEQAKQLDMDPMVKKRQFLR